MLKYPLLVIVSIFLWLLNLPLALILPFFTNKEGWLPRWLWWFQTQDNSLHGDEGWKLHCPDWQYHSGMTLWLWRNPCQGFDAWCKARNLTGEKHIFGNTGIKDREGAVEGFYVIYQGGYFEFRMIIKLPKQRCLITNLGWGLLDENPVNKGNFAFTPFRIGRFYNKEN